jgi:hypothetical protein
MAISRAQLLKELLPGLNALFGLEYATYGNRNIKKFMKLKNLSVLLKKRPSCRDSPLHQSRTRVLPLLMTMHRKRSRLGTTTRPSLLASPSLKKLLRTTCMTRCLLVTPRLWPVQWLTPSRSKPHAVLNNASQAVYVGGDGVSLFLLHTLWCLVEPTAIVLQPSLI